MINVWRNLLNRKTQYTIKYICMFSNTNMYVNDLPAVYREENGALYKQMILSDFFLAKLYGK